ncbi:MAG: hypothetical protein WC859_00595 [Elusimicrobiota bacterium]|jgi:hypothetical protein
MRKALYRSRSAPKKKSRARVWHRKPAAKPLAKRAGPRSNFQNISQEKRRRKKPGK